MTDQPLLSVIIPVYKAERSLHRCVDSLLCQLYTNLEIWLVDDGSPDGSPAICDDYAARDRRVHVIHSPIRAPSPPATRAGRRGGALIGFVDADDWLEPNMYETLYALLRDTAADIAQCEMVNDGAYQQMRSVTLGGPVTYRREQLTEAMFRNEISHNLMNKLYRAEIWKGFHFQEGLYHLDAAFMCRLPERCARLSRTDAALYHYNTDGGSITRRPPQYGPRPQHAEPVCRVLPGGGVRPPRRRLLRLPGDPQHRPAPAGLPRHPLPVCIRHIRCMHRIFKRHWPAARTAEGYRTSPRAKKLLWHIYACAPVTATALVYPPRRRQEHGPQPAVTNQTLFTPAIRAGEYYITQGDQNMEHTVERYTDCFETFLREPNEATYTQVCAERYRRKQSRPERGPQGGAQPLFPAAARLPAGAAPAVPSGHEPHRCAAHRRPGVRHLCGHPEAEAPLP